MFLWVLVALWQFPYFWFFGVHSLLFIPYWLFLIFQFKVSGLKFKVIRCKDILMMLFDIGYCLFIIESTPKSVFSATKAPRHEDNSMIIDWLYYICVSLSLGGFVAISIFLIFRSALIIDFSKFDIGDLRPFRHWCRKPRAGCEGVHSPPGFTGGYSYSPPSGA